MSENQTFGPPPEGRQNSNPYDQGRQQPSGQWDPQSGNSQYQSRHYPSPNPPGWQNSPPPSNAYQPGAGQPGSRQAGAGQQTPPTAYYQAPQYARPGQPVVTPPEQSLSNTIALIAFGSMLVAAALGIAISISGNPGRGLLLGVALCALIAGGVLIYAALRGQRPGWFLAVSIVGAILAIPVAGVGAASAVYDSASGPLESSYSWSLGESDYGSFDEFDFDEFDFEDEGWLDFSSNSPLWAMVPTQSFDPYEAYLDAYETMGELDLTELEPGVEIDYQFNVQDSYIRVLLRKDQLIRLYADYVDDSMITVGTDGRGLLEPPLVSLAGSSASGEIDTEAVDALLKLSPNNAENTLWFNISADDSLIEFLYVDNDPSATGGGTHTEIESSQSGSTESDKG